MVEVVDYGEGACARSLSEARAHNIAEDEEVAELRAFVCSSAASHVSGASLTMTVVGRPVEREISP
jgi:NAD(P)-dependent dehydrogenase (short-subunit alcohol dehydrogenase family)